MASEIHTMSPQTNIDLISESLAYNNLSKSDFRLHDCVSCEENREYGRYGSTPDIYNHETIGTCNLNITVQEYHQDCPKPKSRVNSPQGYEIDERNITFSLQEIPKLQSTEQTQTLNTILIAETKPKRTTFDNKPKENEFYQRPYMFSPNLYQPNVTFNKNSKYYFHGSQRTKFLKNSEEIERKVHGLMRRFQSRASKLKIDANPPILLNGGPWDSLNQAIWDVYAAKIQKHDTYINKLNLWKAIFLFFKACLSNYGLYLVGSTMSGFALEGSDIDICLLTKPYSNEPRVDSLHHLNYLQHALLKNGLATEAELVMAKVPILKFKNKEAGFEVDLNCNNVVGVQNTRLLYCYSQLDWRVRPLVVIVKIWAQANNINDAKNMTISSYSWTLMVIHFLQCGVFPPVLPCLHSLYPEEFSSHENRTMDVQGEIDGLREFESENTRCLGDLLIGFFHYYSYFNYQHYAISVRTGSRLPIELCKQVKSPKNDPHQWKYLCIEEPFDLSNTARSVFDLTIFKHIKQVIVTSYKELACNKDLNDILPIMHLNGQR